jgi:hypothetical protein
MPAAQRVPAFLQAKACSALALCDRPSDAAGLPLVVEVFPRLLTGLVIKSRQSERERSLSTLGIPNEKPTSATLCTRST